MKRLRIVLEWEDEGLQTNEDVCRDFLNGAFTVEDLKELDGFACRVEEIRPKWKMLHPKMTMERLGFMPEFLVWEDPRPAKEQFKERYVGGWQPLGGWTLHSNNVLSYPGDPEHTPLAELQFRDELIVFYPYAWVAIIQKNRSFEVARLN